MDDSQKRYSFSELAGGTGLLGANSHSLRITHTDAACSNSIIQEGDSEHILYSVEYKLRNPNLRLSHPGDSKYFGSATMHMFSDKIDVDVRGLGMRLKPTKDLCADFTYTSPAMQHQTMKWQSKAGYGYFDLVCVDESQTPIAAITSQGWKQNKYGKIEMTDAAFTNEAVREELLLTGLILTFQTGMAKTPSYAPAQPKAMGMGSSALPAATSTFASIH